MENVYQNPLVLKIHNGTVQSDKSICPSCRHSQHMISAQTGRERMICQRYYNPIEMREPIARCSQYSDKNAPTLSDMQDIAWTLMTDKGGRKIGFQSPEQREKGGSGPIGF